MTDVRRSWCQTVLVERARILKPQGPVCPWVQKCSESCTGISVRTPRAPAMCLALAHRIATAKVVFGGDSKIIICLAPSTGDDRPLEGDREIICSWNLSGAPVLFD
jgi:hypothetical protein